MSIYPNIVTKRIDGTANDITGHVVGSFLSTPQPNLSKAETTGNSVSAYPTAIPTITAPSTAGATMLLYNSTTEQPNLLLIAPYSAVNNATSPGVRIIGWRSYVQSANTLYFPTVLADLTLTYSTNLSAVSIDGVNRHFFYAITSASGVPTVNVYSPGSTVSALSNPPACALIDTVGSQIITAQFKGSGSATTFGALYCVI